MQHHFNDDYKAHKSLKFSWRIKKNTLQMLYKVMGVMMITKKLLKQKNKELKSQRMLNKNNQIQLNSYLNIT